MSFLFAVCQAGAEAVLKDEIISRHREFRFAFSRPGFVTFKVPDELRRDRRFELRSVFARTWGFSIDKVTGTDGDQLARDFWTRLGERYPASDLAQFKHLHVWERDRLLPGDQDFEPGVSVLAEEISGLLDKHRPAELSLAVNVDAAIDDRVLDCVIVEPGQWWFGWHRVSLLPSQWVGGVPDIEMPETAVSRTYLKMREALIWSGLPIQKGDSAVEIGSSPGGSCQALLEHGLAVTGIDPADMDPALLSNPYFRHVKARSKDLPKKMFTEFRWLMSDATVVPKYTLDTVEPIVQHRFSKVEGMLLTLKLTDWHLASQIREFHKRIRSWGFPSVRSRQLAFDRREICVAATGREVE
jgi:23S rRNA (cytidine2498-2'-O)-methyltransferase